MRISDWSSDVCSSDLKTGLAGHFLGADHRLEGHVFRASERIDLVEEGGKRKPEPRDHHRPSLDAAQSVGAVLEWQLHQFLYAELLRLADQAIDLHRPRQWFEVLRILRGVALSGSELVEIIVGRHRFLRRLHLVDRRSEEHTSELQSIMRISY